jgi:hypothetical protein
MTNLANAIISIDPMIAVHGRLIFDQVCNILNRMRCLPSMCGLSFHTIRSVFFSLLAFIMVGENLMSVDHVVAGNSC